jgi:acetoin utilization deacetylase AcuC-like enzyme
VLNLASRLCTGKLVAILEGGYSLNYIGKIAAAIIAKMAGVPYTFQDKAPVASAKVKEQAEKIIREAKSIQSSFWDLQSQS